MLTTEESSIQNLIPEKVATFSCDPGVYFSDFLEKIAKLINISLDDIIQWEDETIFLMLERGGHVLSVLDTHKLKAYKNFNLKEDAISTSLEFSNLAAILNGDIPITDSLDTIDPAYIAWAVTIAAKFHSDFNFDISLEVADYIVACFYDEGFLHMPKSLSMFNDMLQVSIAITPIKKEANDKIKRVDDYVEAKLSEYKKPIS